MLEIDGISTVQNPYASNIGKAEKIVINQTRPIYPNKPMRGLDALGVYNASMLVKGLPVDKEPLPLIYNPSDSIDSIEGERILSSDGNLVGIKAQDDKTETYYTVENDEVKFVSVKDKATGKELKHQRLINIDNNKSVEVVENSLSDDTIHKATWYANGIIRETTINKTLPDDKYISVSYDNVTKNESIYFDAHDEHANIEVNDKQQITRIYRGIRKNGMSINKTTNLYNGAVISESIEKNQTIPNMAGLEIANVPELKPSEEYIIDENAKSNAGDKTYYSNGAIESNKLPNGIIYYYNSNGDVQKIIDGNKTITYDGKAQRIEEILENSEIKITTRYKNDYEVLLKNATGYKSAGYLNGSLCSYEEGNIDSDGIENCTKTLYFDKNGMLEASYDC